MLFHIQRATGATLNSFCGAGLGMASPVKFHDHVWGRNALSNVSPRGLNAAAASHAPRGREPLEWVEEQDRETNQQQDEEALDDPARVGARPVPRPLLADGRERRGCARSKRRRRVLLRPDAHLEDPW